MAQSVRQAARQKALEAQRAKRREREASERRRGALGVDVTVAIEERDAAVARHELAAGQALRALTRDEGVSLQDVGEWVPDVGTSEVKRLLRDAERSDPAPTVSREPAS